MKKLVVISGVALMALLLTHSSALSHPTFLQAVNQNCGTDYGCELCHVDPIGGGAFNPVGIEYRDSGNDTCIFCMTNCVPLTCNDLDRDGFYDDYNCRSQRDCNDQNSRAYPGAVEDCRDGIDDDCDGLIDCEDPDCKGDTACEDTGVCTDTDKDGYFMQAWCGTDVDCNDLMAIISPYAKEVCYDTIDNDCDGLVDCDDPECTGAPNCMPQPTPELCDDGRDNDNDGLIDCDDPDCRKDPYCAAGSESGLETAGDTCDDGIDNDGDGLIDCDDSDCIGRGRCK